MRSVSGVLNRTVLAGCGLLIVAASFWLLASGLDAGRFWPDAAPYLATAQDRVGSLIASQAHWLLLTTALVSVLAVIAGLVLLAMQVPRKAVASPLRFSDSEGVLLATVAPTSCLRPCPSGLRTSPGWSSAPCGSPVPRPACGSRLTPPSPRTARPNGP